MNSKSTKRELEAENMRLQKENVTLIDRLANLELDLTSRIEALETEKTTTTTTKQELCRMNGDCYR